MTPGLVFSLGMEGKMRIQDFSGFFRDWWSLNLKMENGGFQKRTILKLLKCKISKTPQNNVTRSFMLL